MRNLFGAMAVLLSLSACVETTSSNNQGIKNRDAYEATGPLSVQTSDVQVYAAASSPTSPRTVVVGPVIFQPNSSISSRATVPVSVVYALKDNPRTQRIKENGAVVYVEATPYLNALRRFPDGRQDIEKIAAKMEEYRYGCNRVSRLVALAPENNYRIEYVTDMEIFFRTRDVAGYPDRDLLALDAGGTVFQAALKPIRSGSGKACFVMRTRSYFR